MQADLIASKRSGPNLAPGLLVMICGGVIRPSLRFLLTSAPTRHNLAAEMARVRDRQGFAASASAVEADGVGLQAGQQALVSFSAFSRPIVLKASSNH